MMFIKLLLKKRKFDIKADRIGPDLPFTHWRLYFKPLMLKLCKKKFKYFADSADIRPGVYAICCSKIKIGERVSLRPGTMLFADVENETGITIEDDANIPIIDQGYSPGKEIILKKGSWIGSRAIILAGVTIGRNSVIGAGSVVTKSVPDNVVAAGNPAKIIKELKTIKEL